MSVLAQVPNQANLSKPTGPLLAMLKSWSISFFIFNFSFLISACGLDVEDPTPPSPPVWVEKSLPEEWPERGIDAHESGGIFLEWQVNAEEGNIVAHHIYRATYFELFDSLGDYKLITSLDQDAEFGHEYIDREVVHDNQYSYKLVAEDISGNMSEESSVQIYTLFPAIDPTRMRPNGMSDTLGLNRQLRWRYGYLQTMENYTITLLNINGDLVLRNEFLPRTYTGWTEYFAIPDTIIMQEGEIYKWRVDMGARYIDHVETAGSESLWAIFLYSEY